ncbi:MAG TPA: GAF domain-containing protein [Coleofasciculaceae cyanobacterium]
MSDRDKSKEQLIQELALLRRQVAQLKITKVAFDAQNELFRTLVTMLQTSTGSLMLKGILQQTVTTACKLTHATDSSLFLLDADGVVTESILARGATIRGQKQRLIGEVLERGFAGWVKRHCKIGLIHDTMKDERWLTLPNQPYTVRSVLGIPILKGKELLGILTLMHPEPEHFGRASVRLMQMTAHQMALIIDNARLYSKSQSSKLESHAGLQPGDHALHLSDGQLLSGEDFSSIGIYIIFAEGNFLYANPRLAEIFGYTFGELVSLESVLELVSLDNRPFVAEQIEYCISGHSKSLSCKFQGLRKDSSGLNVEIFGTRTKLYGKYVIIGALRAI